MATTSGEMNSYPIESMYRIPKDGWLILMVNVQGIVGCTPTNVPLWEIPI